MEIFKLHRHQITVIVDVYNRGIIGGNYALIQELVRDEWGFNGFIITDSANAGSPHMVASQMIRAGADALLRSNENLYVFDATDPAEYHYAREAAHHLLYTTANSRAMNGAVPGSTYVNGMQPLTAARIGVSAVSGVLLALLAGTGIRNHFKRKREREQERVFEIERGGSHFS